jgi:hypothetical protein
MSEPSSGEYSVRSLAEILREHGLETDLGTRPGRRRRTSDDPEVTGRSPRVEPAPRAPRPGSPSQSPAVARSAAAAAARTPRPAPGAVRSPAAASSSSTSSSSASSPARSSAPVWTDQPAPGVRPAAGLAGPATPVREPAPARIAPARAEPAPRIDPDPRSDRLSTTGPVGGRTDAAPPPVRTGRRKSDLAAAGDAGAVFGTGPSTSAIPATGASARARAAEAHPVTGPIPVQSAAKSAEPAAEDDEPLTGRESALAWARFVGELVVALAVGIGLYFAFTVLWELLPYVALVAAPAAVTALVAGVAAWRQKRGQGVLGVRLLAVLLLAGTVLVIAPAAGLLAG